MDIQIHRLHLSFKIAFSVGSSFPSLLLLGLLSHSLSIPCSCIPGLALWEHQEAQHKVKPWGDRIPASPPHTKLGIIWAAPLAAPHLVSELIRGAQRYGEMEW